MKIAVDFGGTTIKIGLIRDGAVIAKTTLPAQSERGLLQRLSAVEIAIKELIARSNGRLSDCIGIGVATPGLVDTDNRTILSINDKYADAVGFSFQKWSADALALPFAMENDARAALIGETAYGVAKGETDAVLMIFGTGIGTAAIMDGRILRGRHHQAGILGGHMTTDIHGRVCNCGNLGCLEAQAGHWALGEVARKRPDFGTSHLSQLDEFNYLTILETAMSGDTSAAAMLESLIQHWSAGIINLIHAYDPEVVILSGGLMKSHERIVPRLMERVHQLAWAPWGKVRFVVAEDPETSVLLGVSHLLK